MEKIPAPEKMPHIPALYDETIGLTWSAQEGFRLNARLNLDTGGETMPTVAVEDEITATVLEFHHDHLTRVVLSFSKEHLTGESAERLRDLVGDRLFETCIKLEDGLRGQADEFGVDLEFLPDELAPQVDEWLALKSLASEL